MRAISRLSCAVLVIPFIASPALAQSPVRGFLSGGFSLYTGADFPESDPGPGGELVVAFTADGGYTFAGIGGSYSKIGAKGVPLGDEVNAYAGFGEFRKFFRTAGEVGNGFLGLRLGVIRSSKEEFHAFGLIAGPIIGAVSPAAGRSGFLVTVFPAWVQFDDAILNGQRVKDSSMHGFRLEATIGIAFSFGQTRE